MIPTPLNTTPIMQDSLSKLTDSLFAAILAKSEGDAYSLPAFTYKGLPFSPEKWQVTISQLESTKAYDRIQVSYLSSDNLIRLRLVYTIYNDYPVLEWVPYLEANGDADTGLVDGFRSLNLVIPLPDLGDKKFFPLHRIGIRRNWGAKSRLDDFMPQDVVMTNRFPANRLLMDTDEGRSSAAWLPFFAIDLDEFFGIQIGIGWSGAWSASFDLQDTALMVNAGMLRTHFRLHPGETIRQPSVFVLLRDGISIEDGQTLQRRFMLDFHTPHRPDGSRVKPPFAATVWGGLPTNDILEVLETIQARKIPYDLLWMDAGWYGPDREVSPNHYENSDWSSTVGDWRVNQFPHPGGLKPISDKAHDLGMRFMLWVEMARVSPNAPIAKQHPEWLLHNPAAPDTLMLNLGNPEARQYAIDVVTRLVTQEGVDCYREDFNFNILPFCRSADSEERQGITEALFIGGFYAFWDELLKRFPDMMIDNCASGGRRLDFESTSRSICLFRSSINGRPWFDSSDRQLAQLCWLSRWLPAFGGSVFVEDGDDYKCMAAVSPGISFSCGYTPKTLDAEWEKRITATIRQMQSCFQGDFYPLVMPDENGGHFIAYQLDDANQGNGFFAVFRPEAEPSHTLELQLRGISPRSQYELVESNGKKYEIKGTELSKRTLSLPHARSFYVAFYAKKKRKQP